MSILQFSSAAEKVDPNESVLHAHITFPDTARSLVELEVQSNAALVPWKYLGKDAMAEKLISMYIIT